MALSLNKRNKHSSFRGTPGPTSQPGKLPQTLQTLSGEAGRHSGILQEEGELAQPLWKGIHLQIHDATLHKVIHRGEALKRSVLETTETPSRAGGPRINPMPSVHAGIPPSKWAREAEFRVPVSPSGTIVT